MAMFPELKSGSTVQYPAVSIEEHRTHVTQFLDGSEQRFRQLAGSGRRWLITLAKLDDGEAAGLWKFYLAHAPVGAAFEFRDPQSGVLYSNCRFEATDAPFRQDGVSSYSTYLIVRAG